MIMVNVYSVAPPVHKRSAESANLSPEDKLCVTVGDMSKHIFLDSIQMGFVPFRYHGLFRFHRTTP